MQITSKLVQTQHTLISHVSALRKGTNPKRLYVCVAELNENIRRLVETETLLI